MNDARFPYGNPCSAFLDVQRPFKKFIRTRTPKHVFRVNMMTSKKVDLIRKPHVTQKIWIPTHYFPQTIHTSSHEVVYHCLLVFASLGCDTSTSLLPVSEFLVYLIKISSILEIDDAAISWGSSKLFHGPLQCILMILQSSVGKTLSNQDFVLSRGI